MTAVNPAHTIVDDLSPVFLRGTSRGLEIVIKDRIELEELTNSIDSKLKLSPEFFAGGDVVLRFAEEPPRGCLGPIEDITSNYDLRIVGVRTGNIDDEPDETEPKGKIGKHRERVTTPPQEAPKTNLAKERPPKSRNRFTNKSLYRGINTDSARKTSPAHVSPPSATLSAAEQGAGAGAGAGAGLQSDSSHSAPQVPMASLSAAGELHHTVPNTTTIAGPIRSGSTVTAPGNLVVVGDVNPGAELHANGSIIVLGSLRGIAHAGYETPHAMILAIKLQPQQLRIGSLIARAGDSDHPGRGAEIAYADEGRIVVDSYQGRVPFGIAANIF